MRIDFTQQLRLDQRMKLSPRIIQAMEILQLPIMALQERIETELETNPCLEVHEASQEGVAAGPAPAEETLPRGEEAMVVDTDNSRRDDFERLADFDAEFGEDLDWVDRSARRAPSGERDVKLDALANTPAPEEGLTDHLLGQWAFVEAPPEVLAAGRAIITNIDEDGYLRLAREELTDEGAAPVPPETFAAALALVHQLDPPGVGARDLRECLLIQLDREAAAGKDVELARTLVAEYLHEIELNHIPQIARRTGRSVQQINEALAALARLDPHPGRLVGGRAVPYIQPDAIVSLDDDGQVVVTMTRGNLPSLQLSRAYRKLARSRETDAEAREFLRRNLRSAQWLLGAIQQRRHTVRRVVEEVFAAQKAFLERGREALRPLPMLEVATKVGVHVATVSRAVAGKYIQTPRGIFPLRMFFSGGKTSADGQDMAWDAIKVKLREVVDGEDKSNPLGDEQLAAALNDAGIDIARRTVAKYRGLLKIPPARQRRQF